MVKCLSSLEMDTVTQVQILGKAFRIPQKVNTLGNYSITNYG